jgi:hypothetical protein
MLLPVTCHTGWSMAGAQRRSESFSPELITHCDCDYINVSHQVGASDRVILQKIDLWLNAMADLTHANELKLRIMKSLYQSEDGRHTTTIYKDNDTEKELYHYVSTLERNVLFLANDVVDVPTGIFKGYQRPLCYRAEVTIQKHESYVVVSCDNVELTITDTPRCHY